MAKVPAFPSVSAMSWFLHKGIVGKIFDLRKDGETGTAKMGILSHFPIFLPPIFLNHIPPQPSQPTSGVPRPLFPHPPPPHVLFSVSDTVCVLRFNRVWHREYRCTYAGLWSALPLVCICLFFN